MKNIRYIVSLIVMGLFFTGCDTNDDTFYSDVFVSSPDLVYIEASLVGYHVGDKIYINCTIDRLLDVDNQANLLDIRKSTGNANTFNFTYILEHKINATDWEVVNVNPATIDVTAGNILGGSFYYASAVYSSGTDSYNFRAGIPLQQSGEYRISFGYNSTTEQIIELRSESTDNNLFLNIISNEGNHLLDATGYYSFTVL